MKLHLPKQLFTALLAAITLATPATLTLGSTAWADEEQSPTLSINIKGSEGNISTEASGTLGGVSVSGWQNIDSVVGTYNLTDQNNNHAGVLQLSGTVGGWRSNDRSTETLATLAGQVQKGYLDVHNRGENHYNITILHDYWLYDATFYLSGDDSAATSSFAPIQVNGTAYIGGTDVRANETNREWSTGNADGSTEFTDANTIKVTNLSGNLTATNVWVDTNSRATLAGLQLTDVSTTRGYMTTLGAGETNATDASWTQNGTSVAYGDIATKNLGITAAAEGSTLKLTGGETVQSLAALGGAVTIAADSAISVSDLYAVAGASLTMSAAQNNGNLDVRGSGSFSFSNDLTLNDTTLTITAASVTVNNAIHTKRGTVNLGNGVDKGMVTASRMELGNETSGTSSLNIASNYTLKVTGSANTIRNDTSQYKTNSFTVSEWWNNTTLNVSGTILAENAAILTGDYGVTINIENGGTVATKGLGRSNPGKTTVSTVNLKEGGTLVLGDMGMDYDGKVTANISGGTIGIAAGSVTIADALNITGALSINTNRYNYGDTGVSEGTTGGELILDGNLTGAGRITKSGSGTLKVNGTIGTAEASMGSITVSGGNMEVLNTSYAGEVSISGGNLTYGGTGVTHTVTGTLNTPVSASIGKLLTVQSGTNLVVGTLQNGWGIQTVVDGTLTATNLIISYGEQAGSTSGAGSITTTGLEARNYGRKRYEISVNELSVGATGISITEESNLYLNSAITLVAGATYVESGSSLNIETGSVTMNGGISGTGTVALSGGSLALGSGEGITNEIAQFNYSGGTLTHSGLTVTNATFSGATLDNTANGTLTLNGTLNVTNIGGLTKGEGNYSGGAVEGNGYYTGSLTVITGNNNLSYGDSFEVQLNGTALTDDSTNTSYYTKSENGTLTLNVTDRSTFIVNTGKESLTYDTAEVYHVAAGATLEFSGTQAAGAALTKSVTGTGTVKVVFDTSNHNESVQFGDGFNGVLEVSGYMHLANFRLGKDATIKLANGQVWNQNATTSAYKILLAGENEDAFSFIGSELTLTGVVSGSYLTTSASMNLLNTDNNITQVKVTGGTTNLNAGTYGTVKSGGGTTNINGGTVGALTIYGGSINLSNGGTLTSIDFTSSDGTTSGSAGGSVHFKKNGETATTYTVGTITTSAAVSWTRSLTVDKGVTLNVDTFSNDWGMDTMTIDGELAASTEIKLATGNQNTSKNIITGSGIVSTPKLIIDNAGTYNFSGVTLKIGEGGLVLGNATWGAVPVLKLGAMTIEATDDWTAASGFTTNLAAADGKSTVINTAGHRVTINGSIEGSGALTKSGEGTLTLSGTNTYTGATTIEAGILEITKVAAVNSSAGVSMESGAGLKYTGSGTETLSTPLSGAGSFTMAGSGTLTLSGANTYTGATTIESGTLQIAELSAISSSSGVSISSGAELKYTGGDATLSKALSGAGSFTVAGTGTLTVSTTLSHTGGTTIESGTLKQSGNNSVLGDSKTVTVKNGATLDVNGQEAYYNLTLGGGDAETAAVLTNTGDGVGDGSKQLYSITLADDATVSGTEGMCMVARDHGQASLNLAGNTLTKTGSNTFTISRATVSEGIIKVLQGKVLAKQAGSGSGTLDLSAASVYVGNQGDSFGTFELDSVNQSVKDLTFDGGKVSTLNQKTLTATGTTQVKSTGGTLSGNLTATDKVSFENGGALKLGTSSKLKVQNAENSAQYIELSGSADASGITATSESSQLAQLQEDASFTIQDMTLSQVKLSAAQGTTVALNNLSGSAELAGAGHFSISGGEAQYTLAMSPVQAQVAAAENEKGSALTLNYTSGTAITMSSAGSPLLLSADPTVDANGIFGTYNLTLTLNYALDGIDVPTTTADWQELVGFTGILGDLLTAQTPEATVDLAEGEAAVAATSTTPTVEYNYTAPQGDAQVGTLVITINGLNVPEPTTATLSLLALAALAARRRRK